MSPVPSHMREQDRRRPRQKLKPLLLNLCQSVLICAICGYSGPGCAVSGPRGDRPAMFGPAQMRINPTFTRFRNFDRDPAADGIEADVELRDAFNDPTKGAGQIYFELFTYQPAVDDVRGPQVGSAAVFDLGTADAQRAHWQNVVRTYRFRLPWRDLDPARPYVLLATYAAAGAEADGGRGGGGGRLFDRLVILPNRDAGE